MKERLEGILLELNDVYSQLKTSQREYFEASERYIQTKQILETQKAGGIANGQITGKNADERESSARALIPGLFLDYGEAFDKERKAKFLLDSAYTSVELVRSRLRVLELLVKLETSNGN